MNSVNPYGKSSSFFNLLSSQLGRQKPEPNTYERNSPSIELGESEAYVPSQWSEGTSEARVEGNDQRSRRNWTSTEYVVLISVWLNTSKDPVIDNEQKVEAFWKMIASYFASIPHLVGLQKREPSHCKQMWENINNMVCKFVGYQSFTFVLGSFEEDQVRPHGDKISKAKSKRIKNKAIEQSSALLEFKNMWVKQKYLAMKEKLSKHKLMESLLAKIESLSNIELALKNKLITEMLNS